MTGYEALVAATGGFLVGALAMLWALTRGVDMDTTGVFDKLFSLLQALLMIRATVGANDYSPLQRLRAKVKHQRKVHLRLKVQRLQARLRALEGEGNGHVGANNYSPLHSAALMTVALALAGCSTCEPVKVPVSVPCNAPMPQRPAMPTEALDVDVALDDFVAAAAAEIERREGYEKLLRAAVSACAAGEASLPVSQKPSLKE